MVSSAELIITDIVQTITIDPTVESALVLGIIVLVRTFLSLSLEIELEGVVPWHRAARTEAQGATTELVGGFELHPPG